MVDYFPIPTMHSLEYVGSGMDQPLIAYAGNTFIHNLPDVTFLYEPLTTPESILFMREERAIPPSLLAFAKRVLNYHVLA